MDHRADEAWTCPCKSSSLLRPVQSRSDLPRAMCRPDCRIVQSAARHLYDLSGGGRDRGSRDSRGRPARRVCTWSRRAFYYLWIRGELHCLAVRAYPVESAVRLRGSALLQGPTSVLRFARESPRVAQNRSPGGGGTVGSATDCDRRVRTHECERP